MTGVSVSRPGLDDRQASAASCLADIGHGLVIAASLVNRIVLSRIAERACLRMKAVAPSEADTALEASAAAKAPGVVIIDVTENTEDTRDLFERLAARRGLSPRRLPLVIAITGARKADELPALWCDAKVVRPVTPETLQPVIEHLVSKARI